MKTFNYKSCFGTTYEGCYFRTSRYQDNDNLAVEIWNHTGCVTRVTVNPEGPKLREGLIAIKDYSENEGMVEFLQEMNLIEEIPLRLIPSGWITIPVFRLTDEGREAFDVRI